MGRTKDKETEYKVIIERDEDGFFIASVPALPGCHTQARDIATLRVRIRQAIELCLEMAKDDARYRRSIHNFAYEPTFIGLDTVSV